MGWFDDQIRSRKKKDAYAYEESLDNLSAAVTGQHNFEVNNNKRSDEAINAILKFFKYAAVEVPDKIEDIYERIDYALRPYGVMRRDVKLEGDWYNNSICPMMAFLEDGSPVALLPSPLKGYTYYDYRTEKKIRVDSKNASMFTKLGMVFYKPFPLKKLSVADIAKYMIEALELSDIIFTMVITLLSTLIGLATPNITRFLFGTVAESRNLSLLLGAAVFLVSVTIGSTVFSTASSLITSKINNKLDVSVAAASMMRMLSLPANFFNKYSSGELTNYQNQLESLCTMLVGIVLNTGLTSLFSLIYVGQIFRYTPSLVVPALIIIVLTLILTISTSLMQMKITKKNLYASSKENAVSYELISGVQKIKLAGAEKRAFAKWANSYAKVAKLSYNPPTFLKVSGVLSTAISLLGNIALYYCAVKSQVDTADYYAFTQSYGMVSGAFMALAGLAMSIAQIRPILDLIKPILDTEPEISENKEIVTSIAGRVEVENLCFRYDSESPYVLNDISFKIRSGDYIAIVGKTGCGKSTLVKLLLGFEKPEKGAIYYDGKNLDKLDPKSLRKKIGVVIQNGKLFSGEISQNILVSAPNGTLDDAWEAAEMAQIAADIREMPMGMNTMITEGSGGVSGGQRQRLIIARALAPRPKFLIFDEATSALDNITQKKVSEALDGLKCTRIVIAHRLSTIKNCDRILVMDKGKIIGDGKYEELIENNEFFAELVRRQRVDVDLDD